MMSGGQLCIKDTVPQAGKTQISTVMVGGGEEKERKEERRWKLMGSEGGNQEVEFDMVTKKSNWKSQRDSDTIGVISKEDDFSTQGPKWGWQRH